jgi:hypothetical protein
MPSDLPLFKYSGNLYSIDKSIKLIELNDNSISNAELTLEDDILISKVVKYLLTEKGTDYFEPTYGVSYLTLLRSVSKDNLSRMDIEVSADIKLCIEYIKKYDDYLKTILFTGCKFMQVEDGRWMLLISIKIVNKNNIAIGVGIKNYI